MQISNPQTEDCHHSSKSSPTFKIDSWTIDDLCFYNVLGREYLVGGVVVSFLRKFMLYNCQSWNLFDQRFVNLVEEPGSGNDGGFEQEVL